MASNDPYLEYDFEDTPRFWMQQDREREIQDEFIERRLKNDNH